jgi:BCCT family betaine/carnitine transporter
MLDLLLVLGDCFATLEAVVECRSMNLKLERDSHRVVFSVSAIGVILFVSLTLGFLNDVKVLFVGLLHWLTSNLDWFFLLSGNIVVLIALGLVVSPWGKVRLGGTEATPDFGYVAWFSMLFSAGMGIGLLLFGVSEPISHYSAAFDGISVDETGLRTDWAPLAGAEGNVENARRLAFAATIFHWGLHPWAIYGVVALALALSSYNQGLPMTLRSAFHPIFGERIWGWPGHIIDILAVFATLFGLATALGIGVQQAAAGFYFLFSIGKSDSFLVLLIITITLIAIGSIVRGLDSGVKVLSAVNMGFAALFLIFIILVGPTAAILAGFFDNLWNYSINIIPLSMPFGREDANFSRSWTAVYWAWWISWSPFVGMFIARISRGRTVRELLIGVLIVPTLLSVLWITALGSTAIKQVVSDGYIPLRDATMELKLFQMLTQLPLTAIASFIGIILVIVFFITSSDSGSLVIDMISSGGNTNTPIIQRVFWASFEGAVAIVLLLGGGLAALQAMAVSTGLVFALVLLIMCYAVIRGLMHEPLA